MGIECDFCRKLWDQVGELPCLHRICGVCFVQHTARTEHCMVCISHAAQVKRADLRFIFKRNNLDGDGPKPAIDRKLKFENENKEFLFCTNEGCDFIGTRPDLTVHRQQCKFQLLSEPASYNIRTNEDPAGDSSFENESNLSKEITIHQLYEQMENMARRLSTVSEQLQVYEKERVKGTGPRRGDEERRNTCLSFISRGSLFEKIAVLAIAIFLVHCYYGDQDTPAGSQDSVPPQESGASVESVFYGVDDVILKARFNKRDMIVSDWKQLQQYQVKLGFGATLSTVRPEVNLWISAEVVKPSESVWPLNQVLQLSLEHPIKDQRRLYNFHPAHSGTWKESVRIHRGQLLSRQVQAETVENRRYLRFSCVLNYEEALTEGFIDADKVIVKLSVRD